MQIIVDILLFLLAVFFFLLLCVWGWRFWLMYVQQKHLSNLKWTMLEIRLPKEINVSPEAMETAMTAFLQSGGLSNWFVKNINGNMPIFFSLEIASLEGSVHFYIRTQQKFKQLIENNLYSQYPGIEVRETEDYTQKVFIEHRQNPSEANLWGITWTPTGEFDTKIENPSGKKGGDGKRETYKMEGDYKMFKTYVDYGLNKNPKEEYKIDPLTPLLEWMGSLGKGEYGWYQIIISDENNYNNSKWPARYVNEATHEHMKLAKLADMRLKQIRKQENERKIKFKKGDIVLDKWGYPEMRTNEKGEREPVKALIDIYEEEKSAKEMDLRPEEKLEVELIHRKMSKPIMLCVMRAAYISIDGQGNFGHNVQSTLANLRPFTGAPFNSLKPEPTMPYDYEWQDPDKKRVAWRREEFFEAYVEREGLFPHFSKNDKLDRRSDYSFWNKRLTDMKIYKLFYHSILNPFYHPPQKDVFALNLEELASFYHFPGQVATTPGIERVDSIKSDAPNNLPI